MQPCVTLRPVACASLVAVVAPSGAVLAILPRDHAPTFIAALRRPARLASRASILAGHQEATSLCHSPATSPIWRSHSVPSALAKPRTIALFTLANVAPSLRVSVEQSLIPPYPTSASFAK